MATPRPRPQVMRLSDAAATRIKEIMATAERPFAGVRVGVKNGGCAGMSYTMEYAEKASRKRKNTPRDKLDYGEARHTDGKPVEVVELYRALDRFCHF